MSDQPTYSNQTLVRRAHCAFCGGLGKDLQVEDVITPLGTRYRIPVSHKACKESALSLSLDGPAQPRTRKQKGAHE